MDRFDDMRARVSGSGGNSGGGGGGPFGVDVVVQATDNFNAGDTFVGTAVSGANPKMYNVAGGLSNAGHISADGTVAIRAETISTNSTTATIYIKNEDAYTEVIVNLPDMSGTTNTPSTSYNQSGVSINEDGSIILINMYTFLVKISVSKKSFSATASRIGITSVGMGDYRYVVGNNSYEITPAQFQTLRIRGSYLFFSILGKYVAGTSTSSRYFAMYGRVTSSSISHEHIFYDSDNSGAAIGQISGINDYGENDLIFVEMGNQLHRFEILGGDIVSYNKISFNPTYITQNGKFATNGTGFYRINQATGTCTQIATFKNSLLGCDETGEYVFYSNKCYRASDTQMSSSLGEAYGVNYSGYYKLVDDSYIGTNGKKYTLLPTSDAEYTIAHTTSVSTAGDIYGVTTEAMTMGETKKALKIFNK